MVEEPKQHDFDQRHDGPFDPPPIVHDSTHDKARHTSEPHAVKNAKSHSVQQGADTSRATDVPLSVEIPARRHSTTGLAEKEAEKATKKNSPTTPGLPPRKSTQISRAPRPSEDFDRRYDGPYGRPSLTMTRRKSSGHVMSPTGAHRQSEPDTAIQERPSQAEDGGPPPPSVDTMQSDPAFEPEPPSLNYDLRTKKKALWFFWSVVIFDSVIMPIGLYFGLWYTVYQDGRMSANTVFSIVTAAIGGISIFEYFVRTWALWKKNSNCRPTGAGRWYFDWFLWNYTIGWVIIMLELIIGTVREYPPLRLVAMPVPSMLYTFAVELLLIDVGRYFQIPAPCRISSIPKGAQLRPGIYPMIEDIVGVDGGGGTEYREALNRRYEASHVFRAMLRRLGLFWSIGAMGMAVVCTILIFTINAEAGYVIGWAAPFVWAGVWTLATFWYAKRKLKEEKLAWAEEVAEKSRA